MPRGKRTLSDQGRRRSSERHWSRAVISKSLALLCQIDLLILHSQIASEVFGLSYAVVLCSKDTSVEDFGNAILDEKNSLLDDGDRDSNYAVSTVRFENSI